jgi:hypothetical protein
MLVKDADVIFNDEYGLWQGVNVTVGLLVSYHRLERVRYGCMDETSYANSSEIRAALPR